MPSDMSVFMLAVDDINTDILTHFPCHIPLGTVRGKYVNMLVFMMLVVVADAVKIVMQVDTADRVTV